MTLRNFAAAENECRQINKSLRWAIDLADETKRTHISISVQQAKAIVLLLTVVAEYFGFVLDKEVPAYGKNKRKSTRKR